MTEVGKTKTKDNMINISKRTSPFYTRGENDSVIPDNWSQERRSMRMQQTNGVRGTKAFYIESQADAFASAISYTALPQRCISSHVLSTQ